MSTPIKLCVDCKWCRKSSEAGNDDDFSCDHPNGTMESPISGKKTFRWTYCTVARSGNYDPYCGPEGKLFEHHKET
jgi:hypothetical protein